MSQDTGNDMRLDDSEAKNGLGASPKLPKDSGGDTSLRERIQEDILELGYHVKSGSTKGRQVSATFDLPILRDYILEVCQEIAREAKLDLVKTFLQYEENQPGYIDWDFLANQLSGLELTHQPPEGGEHE